MRVVAIANQKGGVGKTTTAVNLSAALAARQTRVLLIDLDPQGNATSSFGLQGLEGQSIYSALLGDDPVTAKVLPTRLESFSSFRRTSILPERRSKLRGWDDHLTDSRRRSDAARRQDVRLCAARLSSVVRHPHDQRARCCRRTITPIQCEYFALEGLVKIVRLIDHIHASGTNPKLELGGILMTMFDRRTNLSAQVVAEVREHFGEQVYKTVIPRTVRLSEAPSFGKCILEYDANGSGAKSYHALAEEFLRRHLR